jgi:CHAD domain-containing protein
MTKGPQIDWAPRTLPAVNARRQLPRLATGYFAEARDLLQEVTHPAGLHRLRLISKRLRYTLELFRPFYPPALEERVAALKRVQDLLGDINDAVVSARLIENMPGSVRMRRYLEHLAARKAEAFQAEWRHHFDAPGCESWWIDFLASAPVNSGSVPHTRDLGMSCSKPVCEK